MHEESVVGGIDGREDTIRRCFGRLGVRTCVTSSYAMGCGSAEKNKPLVPAEKKALAANLKNGGKVISSNEGHVSDLTLSGTEVTDAGLVHLKGLTSLEHLDLAHTQISDAGLEHLKGLTKLNFLHLAYTQVTDGGEKELRAALPKYGLR